AASVRESFNFQKAFFGHGVMQFGPRHGVRKRNLNRFAVQFLGEVDSVVDGFLRFAGKTDDEVSVNLDADFLAILHELTGHLGSGALFDVLENLGISGLEAHDKESSAAISHGFQLFVFAVATGGAGPLKLERLEFLAQLNGAVATNVESVVVEENFL